LEQGACHLWYWRPRLAEDAPLRAKALLSPDEAVRYHRYLVPGAAATFLAARILLRSVLSQYAVLPPAAWHFETNQFGRPHITNVDAPRGLAFNLSHKPGCVACLVGAGREVGVDVEDSAAGHSDFLEIAERFFSPSEAAVLRGLEDTPRRQRFFELWTLKESYIKARGFGLSLGLSQFSFSTEGDGAAVLFAEGFEDREETWDFRLFRPDERHVIATSIRRAVAPVVIEITDAAQLLDSWS
jgi:4'-phosphopantetheinyl transferase